MRLLFSAVLLLTLPGCAYVHFGKIPPEAEALRQETRRLTAENQRLGQEIELTRQQGSALREMIEKGPTTRPEVITQLSETSRELASLRVDYARLKEQRDRLQVSPADASNPAGQLAVLKGQLNDTEDKLATALRTYTLLEQENARLSAELKGAQAQNATLVSQVRTLGDQNEAAQRALAQLNTQLLQQKEAGTRAEQALRTELDAVNERVATLTGSRTTGAGSVQTLSEGLSSPTAAGMPVPVLSLETSADVARARVAERSGTTAPTRPGAPGVRLHTIVAGDTLTGIARQYYGNADRWPELLEANRISLANERSLVIGRTLVIP